MGKRFDVCTPRPKTNRQGESDGTWWHRVGNAYQNDKGLITIYLDSVPVPDQDKDNKIVMMLFEPKEKSDAKSSASRTTSRTDDDEIPF